MLSPELINPIESPSSDLLTIEEAVPRIMEIRQRIALMGANDSEFHVVDEIVQNMKNKTIDPNTALEDVTRILNSKQDYH